MLFSIEKIKYEYEIILIKKIMDEVVLGAIYINIIIPIAFILILLEYLNLYIILAYMVFNIIVCIFRFHIRKKILYNIDNNINVNKIFNNFTLLIISSSFSYSLVFLYAILYAKLINISIIMFILMGVITGALNSINHIFRLYLYFVLSIIIPISIDTFVAPRNLKLLNFFIPILLLYLYFILKTAYVSYKERLDLLIIKTELEEMVKLEVQKNREKDIKIFEQAEKAQMGELISMIAHQWRQPLGAINANILTVKSKLEKQQYIKDNIDDFFEFLDKKEDNILKYTKYLSEVIDDFRNFYKTNKEKENKSIIFSINKSLNIIGTSLSDLDIQVIKKFDTEDSILLFHSEMMQVILNILKNSKDNFIEKNIKNRRINILTKKVNDDYLIKISDNGGGIPENIIDKVFNPYFSTKDEKNGTGLGLYMSKVIVEEHNNGKLMVKNIKNGVEFEIFLKGELNV